MNSINGHAVFSFIALFMSPNNDQLPVVVMRQSLFLPSPNIQGTSISKQGFMPADVLFFLLCIDVMYNFTEKKKSKQNKTGRPH